MNKLLKLLLVAVFLNALVWIIIVPVWQYPDEQAHFAQVQYIAEKGNVIGDYKALETSQEVALSEKILGTERDGNGNNSFTYHPEHKIQYTQNLFGDREKEISNLSKSTRSQLVKTEATQNPPLYYQVGSLVYKLFSSGNLFDRVYAIRIMSALTFIGTIIVSYKTGRLIWNGEILPLSLASIVAFTPMLVFSSTGILPDPLTNFLFSLFIFICLKMIKNGFSFTKLIYALIVIILGAQTRQNFLITLFILPFPLLYSLIADKKSRPKIILSIAIGAIALYIASYFVPFLVFLKNFDFPESSGHHPQNPLYHLTVLEHVQWTLAHTFREVWPWYWGIYKWLSLSLPHVTYQIINRLTLVSAAGIIIWLVRIFKRKEFKKGIPILFVAACALIYFSMLTTFDYFFRKNNGYSFGVQGRYLFPVVIAHMALLLLGFWQLLSLLPRKYARFGLLAIVVTFFVFNLLSQFIVASSYYDTGSIQTFILQASQYKPAIIKGNAILLMIFLSVTFQLIFLWSYGTYIIRKHESR